MATNPLKALSPEDMVIAEKILGDYRIPDLVIAPDGAPYIYRWEIVRSAVANVYLHMQVASDPERPLHDHPWDNTSVILSGGYQERINERTPASYRGAEDLAVMRSRHKGDVIFRKAEWPHRLFLPKGTPYTLSLFTTGPKVRDWGFWTPQGWVINYDLIETLPDGRSIFEGAMTKKGNGE